MELAATILLYLCVGLFGIYLIATEFLDTIGRMEIIERKWPKLWAAMSNRPMRLVLLVLLVALLAKDVAERSQQTAPPILNVTLPDTPAPIVQECAPETANVKRRTGNPPPTKPTAKAATPPPIGHFTVTQKSDISTRPDAPYKTDVTVQSDIEFPTLKLLVTCDHDLVDGNGGISGMFRGGSGILKDHRNQVGFQYSFAMPPFGPNNPVIFSVWSKEPVSCTKAASF